MQEVVGDNPDHTKRQADGRGELRHGHRALHGRYPVRREHVWLLLAN
jgi:hypothetical protein